MSLEQEILFKEMDTYLRVSCRGKWNSEIALEIFLQIKQKAKQTKHTRILLDCLEVGPPRNNSDRISAGLDIAAMLGHPLKIAVVYPSRLTTHLAEKIAINRGVLYRVFDQENEALEWLLMEILLGNDL